jgi:hypothetical protein
MIYPSVVLGDSVRIYFTLATLNYMYVNMDHIENAYLTAPITEKVWTVLVPEFVYDAGKRALTVRMI